jgi:hypothetical protein
MFIIPVPSVTPSANLIVTTTKVVSTGLGLRSTEATPDRASGEYIKSPLLMCAGGMFWATAPISLLLRVARALR